MSVSESDPEDGTVFDLPAARARQKLRKILAKGASDAFLPTISNIILILRHDPALCGIISYNRFTLESSITRAPPPPEADAPDLPGPYPRPWTAADEALVLAHIQRSWIPTASDAALTQSMAAEGAMRGFHPITEWLDGLKWDGQPRLDTWLIGAFGAESTSYTSDVGSKFLIAAVRRVRQPGCKFDFMPVFEGKQGIGKSTLVKVLFSPEWFSDSIIDDLGNKDAAIGLVGVWCLEMAEIDHLIRNDVETIKAFLSRPVDKYRPPFGRGDVTRPRQTVLCGTTNSDEYLRDATGNRRFWPVRCTKADVVWTEFNRTQLWAEAAARETLAEAIWLNDEEVQAVAIAEQKTRMGQDAWHAKIELFTTLMGSVTSGQIMEEALSIPLKDQDHRSQLRVAKVLRSLGWAVTVRWEGDKKKKAVRRWERVHETETVEKP